MLKISKNDHSYLTKNFKVSEFFTNSPVPPGFTHELAPELVQGAQLLRDYTAVPWHITSSWRSREHQQDLNRQGLASSFSQHELGNAVDLQPVRQFDRQSWVPYITSQLENPNSELFIKLRDIGINGIGLYDTFVHLDARIQHGGLKHGDDFGSYGFWDYRKKKAYNPPLQLDMGLFSSGFFGRSSN
jgi:hypothetical protein